MQVQAKVPLLVGARGTPTGLVFPKQGSVPEMHRSPQLPQIPSGAGTEAKAQGLPALEASAPNHQSPP